MTSDDPLYRDPSLAEFYDIANEKRDDFDFCDTLAKDARSVLDLGCGTGLYAASLADSRRVTGVDPAAAMLDIARKRPGGEKAQWVQADARHVRLGETFDLIVLTGHAFQVFLTDDDMRATLLTIAAHLAPGGRFIFDTRNPSREEWREWTPDVSRWVIAHPTYGPVTQWNDVSFDAGTGIVTYQTFYEIASTGKTLSADSQIRFIGQERLAQLIGEADLAVDQWLGDWKGAPFTPSSKEIIPIGRLA
jgi:SAM-dependent methyltransferase